MGSGAVDADGVGERPAGRPGPGSGLRVFAAGMLRPGFDALARAAGPGGLRIDYANARDLAGRIVAGEEVDVFASASPDHPRELRGRGLVGEPVGFASNSLVVAVGAASPAADFRVLGVPGTRVVIEVAGIPLGDYTRELLAGLDGIAGDGFSDAVFGNVVFEAQTVFEVADRLLSGDADAGFLYATDVAAHPTGLRAIELPGEAAVSVRCVACVVEASTRRAEAAAWVDGLVGRPVQAVLGRAGFG
ncbi:MAG TPA: substrate-binding domain-containing protein, partial [Solirubrobacteraceae bacterium]|nr:substrate-binding domain-containing protein [Solirubrobacteraceae bacterium]